MNGRSRESRGGGRDGQAATLVRSVPVRLVEVGRGGCRLECSSRLESGASGLLAVKLAGLLRVDDVRIARCQQKAGAGSVFQVGAELLRTRRLGRRTIRMAVGDIISQARGLGHLMLHDTMEFPGEARPREVSGKSDGRAPPAMSDRGS